MRSLELYPVLCFGVSKVAFWPCRVFLACGGWMASQESLARQEKQGLPERLVLLAHLGTR